MSTYYLNNKELEQINKNMIGVDKNQTRIDQIVENVREKLLMRSLAGIQKYRTTLDENQKDNYLNHLQQELMDACNYIEKLLVQRKSVGDICKLYANDVDLGYAIRKIYGEHDTGT